MQLKLACPDDAKISGTYTIGPEGTLKLPYSVTIQTSGLTLAEVRREVIKGYKKYLTSPKISVSIGKRQYYVDVRGLVQKPGKYLVKSDSSLDFIISQAGGLLQGQDQSASAKFARIEQLGVSKLVRLRDYFSGREDLVPAWQGGETVFLQSEMGGNGISRSNGRTYVQMLGQVRQPGEYAHTGDDFYSYLELAGGPTDRADLNSVTLLRSTGEGRKPIQFQGLAGGKLPEIRAGDTIIVSADNPSNFEKGTRVVGGVTGIISALATVALLLVAL
jgi:protein involved in polysaccharide export with SLBB domain